MNLIIKMFLDHLYQVLYLEGFCHELIATGLFGFTDVLLESIGAEGDDRGIT